MTLHTLRQMARGGIYDQLGGGFHRYSVDERWLVPHFEKMLYDNAQLVPLYLAAYQISGDSFFATIARETLDYVSREMRDPAGGFYSTQDADSEGDEGKFFVWERSEVEELLGRRGCRRSPARYWDVTRRRQLRGSQHPPRHPRSRPGGAAVSAYAGADRRGARPRPQDPLRRAQRARRAGARRQDADRVERADDQRLRPRLRGLRRGSAIAQVARAAVAFVDGALRRGDRLLATCKDGVSKLNGYLDDYAFFTAALLDLYEAVQEPLYLESARRLADSMLEHFWDRADGGFFFTSDDHEELIVRSKPSFDGSIPSGNSVATMSLLRLYHHGGEARYLERAEELLRLYGHAAIQQPFGMAHFLAAADFHARGPREIAVVVSPHAVADPLLRGIRSLYLPNRTLSVLDPNHPDAAPPALAGKRQVDGQTTVYVCHRMTCSAPATSWNQVEALLTN